MTRRRLVLLAVLFAASVLTAKPITADPLPAPGSEVGASALPLESGVLQATLLRFLADPTTFTLIDARSADEYAASHVSGAINIPHDSDALSQDALPAARDAPLVVYCRTGERASALGARLASLGYSDVRVLDPEQILWSEGLAVFNCAADPAINELERPMEDDRD